MKKCQSCQRSAEKSLHLIQLKDSFPKTLIIAAIIRRIFSTHQQTKQPKYPNHWTRIFLGFPRPLLLCPIQLHQLWELSIHMLGGHDFGKVIAVTMHKLR